MLGLCGKQAPRGQAQMPSGDTPSSSLPTPAPSPTREPRQGPVVLPRPKTSTIRAPKPEAFPCLARRGYITCLLIPTGKLEPLMARLMGATTATRVGDGADCLFLGGNAGGGLKQIKRSDQTG